MESIVCTVTCLSCRKLGRTSAVSMTGGEITQVDGWIKVIGLLDQKLVGYLCSSKCLLSRRERGPHTITIEITFACDAKTDGKKCEQVTTLARPFCENQSASRIPTDWVESKVDEQVFHFCPACSPNPLESLTFEA